jgi:O-antigen/teichoic acid export membrane protein
MQMNPTERVNRPSSLNSGSALARYSAVAAGAELLVFPTGIITAAFLTRALGAEVYGQLSLIFALTALPAWTASTVVSGRAAVKLISATTEPQDASNLILTANLGIGVLVAGIFALLSWQITNLVGQAALGPFLLLASVEIVMLPIVRAYRDILTGQGHYEESGLAIAVFHISRLLGVLLLVSAGCNLIGVIVANILARAAAIVWCRRYVRPRLFGGSRATWRDLLVIAPGVFVYALCLQTFNNAPLIALGIFKTSEVEVGYYAAAQNLAVAPGLLSLAVAPILIAAIVRNGVDSQRAQRLAQNSLRIACGLCAMAAPVAAGAAGLVAIIFGKAFAPTAPLFAWLIIGGTGGLLISLVAAQLAAAGKYFVPLTIMVPMVGISLVAQALLIPSIGALGAALSVGLCGFAAGVCAILFLAPVEIQPPPYLVAVSVLSGTIGFFVASAIPSDSLPLADVAVGIVVTVAGLTMGGVFRRAEFVSFFQSFSAGSTSG